MKDTKKRNRKRQDYRPHINAVSVTVYDPTGETIPAAIRNEIEESVFQVAFANKLLINIALT